MRYATAQTIINAPFPIKQYGHLIQVDELCEYHDDLYARLIYLEDEIAWLHISADNLQFELHVQKELEKRLRPILNPHLKVTLSTTHAHHCCDSTEEKYQHFFIEKVVECAKNLKFKEGNLSVAYTSEYFDEVGKSRISHHTADALQIDLFQIYDHDEKVIEIVIHNVHPTILYAKTAYFSSEFPGYLLRQLNEVEPHVFHSYMSGPSGDISTRFTRADQTYASVEQLGKKLFYKVQDIKKKELKKENLKLDFKEEVLKIEHSFHEIDLGEMPSDLTEREIETIGYGQIMRARLKDDPNNLIQEALFTCVSFGPYSIIFEPIEMFSYYRTAVNIEKCALVCYSNGCGPYITGPNQSLLTYETFTDTLKDDTKFKIVELLNKWGQ